MTFSPNLPRSSEPPPRWAVSDGSDNLSATVATDRAFPAAVAELGRSNMRLFCTFLVGMLAGCGYVDRSGAPVRFIVPDGYRGEIRLIQDPVNGLAVRKIAKYTYVIFDFCSSGTRSPSATRAII